MDINLNLALQSPLFFPQLSLPFGLDQVYVLAHPFVVNMLNNSQVVSVLFSLISEMSLRWQSMIKFIFVFRFQTAGLAHV